MAKTVKARSKNNPQTTVKTATPIATPSVPIAVEFPKEKELIMPGHYGIRVAAPYGMQVEVSIDGGSWHPSRFDTGHYWVDWFPTKPGNHTIKARAKIGENAWASSPERTLGVIDRRKLN